MRSAWEEILVSAAGSALAAIVAAAVLALAAKAAHLFDDERFNPQTFANRLIGTAAPLALVVALSAILKT
jgi:hypothetical protein